MHQLKQPCVDFLFVPTASVLVQDEILLNMILNCKLAFLLLFQRGCIRTLFRELAFLILQCGQLTPQNVLTFSEILHSTDLESS